MTMALDEFIARMDDVVARSHDPVRLADGAARHVEALLAHPEFLEDRHRRPRRDRYAQHVVYVHPQGRYSVVSLVWLPGQRTPVHDHRCWCVVGVLEGSERETRYGLVRDGREECLVVQGTCVNVPGGVSRLVPPEENVHQVENAGDRLAISIHVYGADIATCGTSINQVFTQPVRPAIPGGAAPHAWRTAR